VLAFVEGRPHRVDPGVEVDPHGHVQGVGLGRERVVQPPAREIERVAGAEGELEHRLTVLAERFRVALLLQRQLEQGVVDPPLLLAGDLEHDDVMRVVVDCEALRATRGVVRIRLGRVAELGLEPAAEPGQRRPVQVQALEHDCRAVLEGGRDAVGVGAAGESVRAPGQVG
jgi:hypothetical protein